MKNKHILSTIVLVLLMALGCKEAPKQADCSKHYTVANMQDQGNAAFMKLIVDIIVPDDADSAAVDAALRCAAHKYQEEGEADRTFINADYYSKPDANEVTAGRAVVDESGVDVVFIK
jgi:hypothetical protein